MGGKVTDENVAKRVISNYMRAMADRALLGQALEDFEKRHNELYTLLVTIIRQNGGEMFVDKDFWPALPCGEYLVDWEDVGDEVRVRVRHFSEDD